MSSDIKVKVSPKQKNWTKQDRDKSNSLKSSLWLRKRLCLNVRRKYQIFKHKVSLFNQLEHSSVFIVSKEVKKAIVQVIASRYTITCFRNMNPIYLKPSKVFSLKKNKKDMMMKSRRINYWIINNAYKTLILCSFLIKTKRILMRSNTKRSKNWWKNNDILS